MPYDDETARPIDRNFAMNLRHLREEAGMSQEELAAAMTEAGFPFSQATVWKIEQLQRPVRLAEAFALAAVVGDDSWPISLHLPPGELGLKSDVYASAEELDKCGHAIKHWSRKFVTARRRFWDAVDRAKESGIPDDDMMWNGVLDGSDWEAPEFLALEARYEVEEEEYLTARKADRRNQLKRVWNTLVPEEIVVPPPGEFGRRDVSQMSESEDN